MMAKTLFSAFLVWYAAVHQVLASIPDKSDSYIILMDPQATPKPFSSHHTYYSSLLTSLKNVEKSEPIYTYTNSIHGFSARLSPDELKAIKNSKGYLFAIKDVPLKLTTTHSSHFLGLNSISGAWPASDFGRDVIIGVVDTGIWPESQSFTDDGMTKIPTKWKGGCYGGTEFNTSMCNRKLVGARFFNEGQKAGNPEAKNITFIDSVRDLIGHGTHVSSIAAGNYIEGVGYFGYATGTAKGMAPRARLAMYKVVFTKNDGPNPSDVIAAIDSAIEDGIDVLSLSIASSSYLYEDPVAIATFSAVRRGIFVSQAAGNSGPSLWSIPSGPPWALIVGASTVDREFRGTVNLGNGVSITGSTFYPLINHQIPSPLPIVYTNVCGSWNESEVIGKIVLCHIDDYEPGDFALVFAETFTGSGAAGAIVILNTSDLPQDEIGFPAIFVNRPNGKVILDYVNTTRKATATLWFQETSHGTKPAPKVAPYSSRGPSLSCPFILKPDIVAPGYSIFASWQEQTPASVVTKRISSFRVDRGTSMAAPHAAGIAALLKGAHRDWSPAAIRSAMMTTADVLDNIMTPIKEWGYFNQAATPLAMGAGHINPNKALDPGLLYDANETDYIDFLCALNFNAKQLRAITRSANNNCSISPSINLNYPSFFANFGGNGTKSVQFQRTLTNVGNEMSRYSVKLSTMKVMCLRSRAHV